MMALETHKVTTTNDNTLTQTPNITISTKCITNYNTIPDLRPGQCHNQKAANIGIRCKCGVACSIVCKTSLNKGIPGIKGHDFNCHADDFQKSYSIKPIKLEFSFHNEKWNSASSTIYAFKLHIGACLMLLIHNTTLSHLTADRLQEAPYQQMV
jgi:hypothetical protein